MFAPEFDYHKANSVAEAIQLLGANDLGSDVIGDFCASAEYRRAMAAVEIRHALFHITGEAHVGSRAESVLHGA